MEIKQINVLGQTYDIRDAFGRALIASEFDSENEYASGDFCIYSNNLYKCLSSTTGSWDSSAWSSTTIVDNLSSGGGEGYNFDITQDEWDTIVAINDQTISGTLNLSGVTEITDYMFYKCSSLEEVNFPDCIKIGQSAFEFCSSLQSVNFPTCTTINYKAFNECHSLQTVNFPTCTTISQAGFGGCDALQSVSFPNCITIGTGVFAWCQSLKSANFPVCTTIDSAAFTECNILQTINFPVCTSISDRAFNNCYKLQSVDFSACTTIGSSAFYSCKSLSAIYLLASSICTLANSNAFQNTPMSNSTYTGNYGSIYVPSSLVDSYKTATNWTYYADRIVGV